jgi:PAS domain S-box-containing protein
MKLSLVSRVSIIIAVAIMLCFFAYQTALVIGYAEITYNSALFGWASVILFMPFFFFVLVEFVRKVRYKFQSIDDTLSAINQSNALVEFDLDGTILSCNDNFCEISGYQREELIGKNHRMMTPADFAESEYKDFWFKLKKGFVKSGEFRRVGKHYREFWIYGNYNPIKNPYGEVYRILKIASDITDKKGIEMEIHKKNGYLEHAAKILRHDMHSGINTYIPRGLSSLKRRLTEEDIKDLKISAPLKMIQEGLIHTQKVYKGVKEFTNLVKKDTQLEKSVVDLKEVLHSYLSSTSYIKQVEIKQLVEHEVNEALFCTAIDNLIRNGLKYNDSSTKMVSIYMDDEHTLAIEDNGRGMSQEDFDQYSQPYTRGKQEEKGTGLGLNICVAIIEEHGFSIKAQKLTQGTKITIKLND